MEQCEHPAWAAPRPGLPPRGTRAMFTAACMHDRTRSAPGRARVRARRTAALAAIGVTAGAGLLVFASTPSGAPEAVAVSATLDLRHPGRPVPRSFNGLSFELTSLREIARFW